MRTAESIRLALLAGAACLATSVHAQEAAAPDEAAQTQKIDAQSDSLGLQEIVVTAQKRSENLQQVPIAITAFTADAIATKAISTVQALGNLSPGVNLDAGSPFSGSSAVLSASIRGIGQDDFAFNTDPGVGVYVDGVYLARTIGANTDLLDVERIEILKGPQGTLFGRNTIGGAISIVTRDPADDFRFKGRVVAGSYRRLDTMGSLDVPFSDALRSTITFSTKHRDGYQKRIRYPGLYVADPDYLAAGYSRRDTQGGENSQTLRAKLLYDNGGPIRLTLTGDYTHQNQSATANTVIAVVPGAPFATLYNSCISLDAATLASAGLGDVCSTRANVGTPLAGANAGGPAAGPRLPYSAGTAQTGDIDTSYATGQNFDKLITWGLAATLQWEIAPEVSIKSITAYRKLEWDVGLDADGSPLDQVAPSFSTRQKQLSQELQLIGKAIDNRLDYVLGLYYFNEKGSLHDLVKFGNGLLQVDGLNTLDTTSYAGFAHLEFAITDRLGVTLGARYSHEKKSLIGGQRDPNAFFYKLAGCYPVTEACRIALGFPDPEDPYRFFPPGVQRASFDVFTPRLGVQYKFSRDVMAYATYTKGFKSGGWTTRLTVASSVAPSFQPEKAQTFEAGIKSELFDRRVRVNLAGFTTKYSGIQLNFQEGLGATFHNAGDARIKGVEADIAIAPAEGLTLTGTASYMDAQYTRIEPGVIGVSLDNRLPKTPEWKLTFSPEYRHRFGDDSSVRAGFDLTYTSAIYNDVTNDPLLKRGATTIINASLSYALPGDKVEFTIGGTNLTDERYLTTGSTQAEGGGMVYGTYSAPAQWYASVGFKF